MNARRAALTAVTVIAWLASLPTLHHGIDIYYTIVALASGLLAGVLLGITTPHWLSTLLFAASVPTAVALLGPLPALVLAAPLLSSSVAYLATRLVRPKPRYSVLLLLESLALTLVAAASPASMLALASAPLLLVSTYYAVRLLPGEWRFAAVAYSALAVVSALPGRPFLAAALIPALTGSLLAAVRGLKLKPSRVIIHPPRGQAPFIRAELVEGVLFALDTIAGYTLLVAAPDSLSLASGYIVIVYGLAGLSTSIYRIVVVAPRLAIRPHYSRWYVALLIKHERLAQLLEAYAERIKPMLQRAAVFEDPVVYASKRLTAALLTLAATPSLLPLALLSPTLGATAVGAALLAACSTLASPWLELPSKAGERRRRVEDELPWFVLLAASLQAAGVSLFEAFRRLRGSILPAMEREARLLERTVMVEGVDWITAMERLADTHPSRSFADLLRGYTSLVVTGGDLLGYLEDRVREQLEWLRFRLRQFAERVVTLGEVMVIAFVLLTSIFAIVGGAVEQAAFLQVFTYLGIPLMAAVFVGIVQSMQLGFTVPEVAIAHGIPAVAVAVAAAWGVLSYGYSWAALTAVIAALGLGYGAQWLLQVRIARAHEAALPLFVRDLLEYRKIGLPPSSAILDLAERKPYNQHFNALIEKLAAMLRLDVPLDEAVLRLWTPSRVARIVLFTVAEIEATGGGTPRVLETLHRFLQDYYLAYREMKSQLRLYEALMYAAPVMLASFASMSAGIAEVFTVQLQRITSQVSGAGVATPTLFVLNPASVEATRLMVVEASAAMATVGSKAIDGSLKATLRLTIVALILAAMLAYADPLVRAYIHKMFAITAASQG
ncbi:Type II secretion system F protein [Pyrolobus fumarii 1A]|uniref:Type II secretion system F protein n=1 Tax=Pyrolobus fumarii (strain DSM 11204 / 1A) TaxID=694429 RepID=G0EFP9_PYRF1|nr:type II secretion system F family protein [Pyrolobus fumarii]AEM38220.1 Type II secretion system F protein [Pyrolobus fumarii 1A]